MKNENAREHALSPQDTEAVLDILVEQLNVQRSQLTPTAQIRADLGSDSLDDVEIALTLEDRFHLSIPDDQSFEDLTVAQLLQLIATLRHSA